MIPDSDSLYNSFSLVCLVCYTWVSLCARQGTVRLLIFPMLRFEFRLATMPSQDHTRDIGRET